ncbi:sporulation protein [Dactylosporangium roseum]|uniref:Sporulation protein n=1 Tax=Dactylosporangium roseum TaxID=47989 RepID=A0ABY5ZE56_9ACTN|nr:sporulation protein [Dactylosporangium roseum]UWZ40448.1 sporulation protein [Dactylosporangium roseum]
MLAAFGVGSASVDTVLTTSAVQPGGFVEGHVHITGGDHDVQIEQAVLSLVTRVEVESGDYEHHAGVELAQVVAAHSFRVAPGERQSIPFRMPVPWEAPITEVYGQHLRGMVMGVRTELVIAKGRDKGDLDPVAITPLPVQQGVLDGFAANGFRFKHADVEHGRLHGVQQTLPIFQEIEFWPPPQHAGRINEVELTFVANPYGVDVILEFDKRGGVFSSGHDAYSRFSIRHDQAAGTDWAAVVDGWVREATSRYFSHLPPGYGHGGSGGHGGYGGHGHGPHHRGPGMGTVVAAGAAGVVGGIVAGEVFEEVFEDDGGDFEF